MCSGRYKNKTGQNGIKQVETVVRNCFISFFDRNEKEMCFADSLFREVIDCNPVSIYLFKINRETWKQYVKSV